MSFMFSRRYVYDNWVKLDVIGEMCSIQDKSENCMEDFSWKSRNKETSWKMYVVHQRFMLSGSYRNEELQDRELIELAQAMVLQHTYDNHNFLSNCQIIKKNSAPWC